MKSIILAVALLASDAVSAYADSDSWTASHPRSNAELYAANSVCDAQFGAP
jgi:hypothetical protein